MNALYPRFGFDQTQTHTCSIKHSLCYIELNPMQLIPHSTIEFAIIVNRGLKYLVQPIEDRSEVQMQINSIPN